MRTCFCGKSLAYKQATALYCSGRCGKRAKRARERGVAPTAPVEVPKVTKPRWPRFVPLYGSLSASELHCAGVSDRDYETGHSSYLEIEDRNRRALLHQIRAGLGLPDVTAELERIEREQAKAIAEDPYRYFDGAKFKEDEHRE